MKCHICEREIINKGALTRHEKTCIKIHEIKTEVIYLYTEKYMSINNLSKKFKIGKKPIGEILGDKMRSHGESIKLLHKLHPELYKHTEETKQILREKRLEYMKNNPEKTAWRSSNLSYPEKVFKNKLKEMGLDKKFLIVREYSVFPYFIDFAFVNEKVAVEIDGSQHSEKERSESDRRKDEILEKEGWRVIRISAKNIKSNINTSINKVLSFLSSDKVYEKVGIFKNKKEYVKKYYCKCGNKKAKKSKKCFKCDQLSQRKVDRPSYDQLTQDVSELGYSGTGRKYGVSDNSIRKWVKMYKKYGCYF